VADEAAQPLRHVARAASVIGVPLAVGMSALAYYGIRSQWMVFARDEFGMGFDRTTLTELSMVAVLVGTCGGVIVGAIGGPAPATAFGLSIAVVGALGIAGAHTFEGFQAAAVVMSVGYGVYRAGAFAAVVRWLGRGWEPLRIAACALCYGFVNSGAVLAVGAQGLAHAFGARALFFAMAMVFGAAALVMAGVFAAGFAAPAETGPGTSQTFDPTGTAAALFVALLGSAALMAWTLASIFGFDVQSSQITAAPLPEWVDQLNPAVVVVTCTLLAGFCAVGQLIGARIPALGLAGLGLLTSAAGYALGLLVPGVPGAALGAVVGGVGESLTFGPLASRVAGEVHFRLSVVPMAILTASTMAVTLAWYLLTGGGGQSQLSMLGAIATTALCAVLGFALLAVAIPLQAWVFGEPPGPEKTQDQGQG
jgi:hypothetical protein